jgi:flagellar hook assembly protein FlgD
VCGSRLRLIDTGYHAAGVHSAHWDGRDASGSLVGAGVYFVRLTAGEGILNRRIVMLR